MSPLRALYHSICLSERIPIRVSPTLADTCLASYHFFQSTDSYRHATASSHTPFHLSDKRIQMSCLPLHLTANYRVILISENEFSRELTS